MSGSILELRGLSVDFAGQGGAVPVVRDVSFALRPGETLGLVGESGCGKSVTALAMVGLLPPTGRVVGGEVLLAAPGGDLTRPLSAVDAGQLRRIRGRRVAMVFQDPGEALNPVLTVGRQIRDVLKAHGVVEPQSLRSEVVRLLTRVGISDAKRRAQAHPHTLSGGQRQRVMIAMALAGRPDVLIADEPTTALDATVQAGIVTLIRELQAERGLAVLWITHDLALAAQAVDRVAVMYAGRLVEEAPVRTLFDSPRHPYSRALVASARELASGAPGRQLTTIPGRPPSGAERAREACAFAPRCPRATARCREQRPLLEAVGSPEHRVACWHPHRRGPAEEGS